MAIVDPHADGNAPEFAADDQVEIIVAIHITSVDVETSAIGGVDIKTGRRRDREANPDVVTVSTIHHAGWNRYRDIRAAVAIEIGLSSRAASRAGP